MISTKTCLNFSMLPYNKANLHMKNLNILIDKIVSNNLVLLSSKPMLQLRIIKTILTRQRNSNKTGLNNYSNICQ